VTNLRCPNGIADVSVPTCFQQYHASYYDLLVGPATGSRTEIIGMPYENDVHYGAVLRESRTHVSVQVLEVANTVLLCAMVWLPYCSSMIFRDFIVTKQEGF